MFTHLDLRKKFADFWKEKNHKEIPPISLVPQNDPTTLFTGSGMQQLVPYLLGEVHPLGKRLYNIQPCFRSQDILETDVEKSLILAGIVNGKKVVKTKKDNQEMAINRL